MIVLGFFYNTALIRRFLRSFVNMCIRVVESNGQFFGNKMKAAANALLHIFFPMWVVVILHLSLMSMWHILWISLCIGPVLYSIRLLLKMPLEDMLVPFMERCNFRVWPHCILSLVMVSIQSSHL